MYLAAIKSAVKDIQERVGKGETDASMDDYDIPAPPFKFTVLKYRQKMGITYEEASMLPASVMFNDMEMFDIEAEYGV